MGFTENTILNKNRNSNLDLNKQPCQKKQACENCFRFRCLFSGRAAPQINGTPEIGFVRQWKWLKDISGNNRVVRCLYTKFVTILQLLFVYFATFQCLF